MARSDLHDRAPSDRDGPAFSQHVGQRPEIVDLLKALDAFAAAQTISDRVAQRLHVVVEELLENAFSHGAAERSGGVRVDLRIEASKLRATIAYDGPEFDPGAPPAEPAASDGVGGRGLRIVQSFSRGLAYARTGETNRVDFEIADD